MSAVTHIGTGHLVVGAIRTGEGLTIAGRVQGRVDAEGLVVVEAGAIVEGDVRARELIVRGVVVGDIATVDGLEVTANGQILGAITTRRLLLRTGGRISGEVTTGVEVQAFTFNERQAGARRSSGATTTTSPARSSFEERFASRAAEGARSWLRETAAPSADATPESPEPSPATADESG